MNDIVVELQQRNEHSNMNYDRLCNYEEKKLSSTHEDSLQFPVQYYNLVSAERMRLRRE
jgi:hypothetical protein